MKFVSLILALLFAVNLFAIDVSTNQILSYIDTIESQQLQIQGEQLKATFYSNATYQSYTNIILLKEAHKKEITKVKYEWALIALAIVLSFIAGATYTDNTQ